VRGFAPTSVHAGCARSADRDRSIFNNVEVPAGHDDLRVFARLAADQEFQFWKTDKLEVSADGWLVNIGCGE
jgi:hypothetical protein